jgi:hypothetical protein
MLPSADDAKYTPNPSLAEYIAQFVNRAYSSDCEFTTASVAFGKLDVNVWIIAQSDIEHPGDDDAAVRLRPK